VLSSVDLGHLLTAPIGGVAARVALVSGAMSDAERDLRRRAEATLDHYHGLSGTAMSQPLGRFLVEPSRPQVWDANHARLVRAGTDDEIDALLVAMDDVYAGMAHRQLVMDLDAPDVLEARLALEGWTLDTALQHVLTGPLRLDRPGRRGPPGLDIRPALDEHDWEAMEQLTRLDHLEESAKAGREDRSAELTHDMVAHRRAKAPAVQAWLARVQGQDVGMFSSMPPPTPGPGQIGLVEDLFVHPQWRGQGISVALIEQCVDDVRARGGDQVLIGSEPTDWPKGLYARLGFRPTWLERWWTSHLG
jgi:GNAT superfamily N-acetyltransferase